jgi:hypothetical protein
MGPPFRSLLLPLDGRRGCPRRLGGRPPTDGPLQGPYVREVRKESHGIIPRPGVVIIAIIILLLRGRLRGGLLLRETLEFLLATSFYLHLALEDLPIVPLLRGIFLLFLLSRGEASHLSSGVIL